MEKAERLMSLGFESETTYGDDDDKYIKTRIKPYKDSIITYFYDKTGFKEAPKEKTPHKCLSKIILDSVIYAYENYYPQTFLEECKYAKTNVKTNNYIDKELKLECDSDGDIYIEESDSDSDMIFKKCNKNNNKF